MSVNSTLRKSLGEVIMIYLMVMVMDGGGDNGDGGGDEELVDNRIVLQFKEGNGMADVSIFQPQLPQSYR